LENKEVPKMDFSPLIKKYDIRLLLAFGSYQTERFTKDSDIDLGYLAKRDFGPEEELQLLKDLVLLYRRDRIDLVNLKKASPLLMYETATHGKVLYEENASFLRFKLKASARYADTEHLRRMRRNYLNKELGQEGN
jgi:predicted nucleotidyltransferase